MKWKALLKDVKGDHLVSRDANFVFIQKFVRKKWFLCKYIYIYFFSNMYTYIFIGIYIYIYVCVYGGNSFCFWGGGKAVESTHHGSRWYCRSWGRAQQELELLPEDGDYPPPDLSSLRKFLLAIDHLEMDAVRHAFAYLYTNCIWVNI